MNSSTPVINARAIIPSLKYDDAPRAIEFLCTAFGFEKHAVHAGLDRQLEYAELRLGGNFIVLGPTDTDVVSAIATPRALAGALGGIYVVLERDAEVDAHFKRAFDAGATIMSEPVSPASGGRNYNVSDCEGHVWTFDSYRPEAFR
jgi:uncharacterized glyoxalase superfamily protein PhnB